MIPVARTHLKGPYSLYWTSTGETYYQVEFRMYLHFEPIDIIIPEPYIAGSPYAPYKAMELHRVKLPSDTLVKNRYFSVNVDHIELYIDDHITEHMDKYTKGDVWDLAEQEMIERYIKDVKKECGVELDPSYIKYTKQFCWEVK